MTRVTAAVIALALLSLAQLSLCADTDKDIPYLSASMLEDTIYLSDRAHLVGLYQPDGEQNHVDQFMKVWQGVANKVSSVVPIWKVNVTNPENHGWLSSLRVERVPHILLYPAQPKFDSKKNNAPYKNPSVLRTFEVKSIVSEALKALPNDVKSLNSASIDKFLEDPGTPVKALLFTNKKKTSALAKGLALEFSRRVSFGEVRDTEEALVTKYAVETFPSFVLIENGKTVSYSGDLKHDPIVDFLTPRVGEWKPITPPPLPSKLVKLSDATYKSRLLESIKTWAVMFHRSECDEACLKAKVAFKDAANDLDGIARLGIVNLDENPEIANKYAPKKTKDSSKPFVRYFPPDPKSKQKRKPAEFKGKITARKVWTFVTDKITNYAETLFDNKGVDEMISRRRELGKVILFTTKKETSALWKAVSYHYKNRIQCIEVHSDSTDVIKRFGVKPEQFPIIVAFIPGEEGKKGLRPVPYQGRLRFQDIVEWLSPIARELDEDELAVKEAEDARDADESELVPRIASQGEFDERCTSKAQLCVLALVADSDVIDGRPHIMTALVGSALKLKKEKSVAFMWANGDKQQKVTSTIAANSGLPALVMVNPRKKAYASLIGSMSDVDSIVSFVRGLLSGRGNIRRIDGEFPFWVDEASADSAKPAKEDL